MSQHNFSSHFHQTTVQSFSQEDAILMSSLCAVDIPNTAKTSTLHPDHYSLEGHAPWQTAFTIKANEDYGLINDFLNDEGVDPANFHETIEVFNLSFYDGCAFVVKGTHKNIKKAMDELYETSLGHLNERLPFMYGKGYNEFLAVWDLSIYQPNQYLIVVATSCEKESCYQTLIKKLENNSNITIEQHVKSLGLNFEALQLVQKEPYAQQRFIQTIKTEKELLNGHISLPQFNAQPTPRIKI